MKLHSLEIANFRGLRDVNLVFDTPVTLIAGFNGAGKTSLLEAIRLAVLGAPERVALKRDYARLITEGSKVAVIRLSTDVGDFGYSLPDGKHTTALPDIDDEIKLAMGALRFSECNTDYRRTLLFRITNANLSGNEVVKRLKKRGATDEKIQYITPSLRAGFAEAVKIAKTKASEARGEWKGITNENYGEKKAEIWQLAERPAPVDPVELDTATRSHALAQERLNNANTALIVAREQVRQLDDLIKTRKTLEERAEPLERFRAKLAVDQKEFAAWETKLAAIQLNTPGNQETELTRQLAECVEDWCLAATQDLQLAAEHEQLVSRSRGYLSTYMATQNQSQNDAKAIATVQQARDSYARAVANDQRDIAAAEQALEALAELKKKMTQPPNLLALQAALEKAKTHEQQWAETLNALQAQNKASAHADTAEERALKTHNDILEWGIIIAALSPEGIQAEIMAGALRPVNDRLFELSRVANWARVQITSDLAIEADGRAFEHLSRSEQWRVNCLIGIVIAEISGSHLIVLDEFDLLDLDGRSDAIELFDVLAVQGAVQIIVAGTLKACPKDLPGGIAALWIDDKTLINSEEAAA